MSTELIARAQASDGEAFRELTDPHRRELQGALLPAARLGAQDAEDALQETLLAAGRASAGSRGAPRCKRGCIGWRQIAA